MTRHLRSQSSVLSCHVFSTYHSAPKCLGPLFLVPTPTLICEPKNYNDSPHLLFHLLEEPTAGVSATDGVTFEDNEPVPEIVSISVIAAGLPLELEKDDDITYRQHGQAICLMHASVGKGFSRSSTTIMTTSTSNICEKPCFFPLTSNKKTTSSFGGLSMRNYFNRLVEFPDDSMSRSWSLEPPKEPY